MPKKGILDGYKTYDPGENGYGNRSKWKGAFHHRMNRDDAEAVLGSQEQTPYEILGVSKTANLDEIKKAFRNLIREWHPDTNPHRLKEAEEMSKKIIAAYTVLTLISKK